MGQVDTLNLVLSGFHGTEEMNDDVRIMFNKLTETDYRSKKRYPHKKMCYKKLPITINNQNISLKFFSSLLKIDDAQKLISEDVNLTIVVLGSIIKGLVDHNEERLKEGLEKRFQFYKN